MCVCVHLCVCVCALGKYWQLFKLAEVIDDLICESWVENKGDRRNLGFLPHSSICFLSDFLHNLILLFQLLETSLHSDADMQYMARQVFRDMIYCIK